MPCEASWAFNSRTTLDFPEAGRPVTQTAKACLAPGATVFVHLSWIEAVSFENGNDERQNLLAQGRAEGGIPDRAGHHQAAEGEEGRHDVQHFAISAALEVAGPETQEQRFQIALELSAAL